MEKKITHTWHYQLLQVENTFSIYFNERLIAMLMKPAEGRWPVHATINERMYSFSKKSLIDPCITIADAISGEAIAFIKMPVISSFSKNIKLVLNNGEEYTWYSNNFFSLHWKWKRGKDCIVDAIDNLAHKPNNGIIAMSEYQSGTDLIVVAGFFLSLLKRSKLSMGILGLKRKRISLR